MGFILLASDNDDTYAYRVLDRKHQLPSDGVPVNIKISFFPEDRKWSKTIPAHYTATPDAVKTSDGIIHLSERVAYFSDSRQNFGDPVIEIEVTGKVLISDKAKRPEARDLGVQLCDNGFYLDVVRC